MSDLPRPSSDALQLSGTLQLEIVRAIHAAGGWISFADYMERVLYTPGRGYYSNGARKFGVDGDFVTAPELGSLFAASLARQLSCWLRELPDVLEIGPGSGRLAFDLLTLLDAMGQTPRHYYLLERSGDLRQRQNQLLQTLPSHLSARVSWLDSLPEDFEGVIVANEVLDALPSHRVGWREHGLIEQGVGLDENGFCWSERPLVATELSQRAQAINAKPPYTSEICPAAPAWVASLLQACSRAALLFIDYGYGRSELYHPQRNEGTLTGFYRHHRLNDPFFLPGLVDLTTHVDFTAVADVSLDHGAQLLGYTTQASFLLDCGLTDALEGVDPRSMTYMKLAQQVQVLMHPAEMGELFKVMAIGKNFEEPGIGFNSPGREYQL